MSDGRGARREPRENQDLWGGARRGKYKEITKGKEKKLEVDPYMRNG